MFWGCVKRFLLALRAKLNLDGDIFFLILRSKIRKKMSPSKEYFAAAGGENLFAQPQKKNLPPQAAKDFLHNLYQNIIWREAPRKDFSYTPALI
jgi:hypothetical protein